jgi:hypothetical protein
VLGRVDQGFGRGPGDGHLSLGRQQAGLAADGEAHGDAVPELVVGAELGQALRQRQRLPAQGLDGPAGLGQPVIGHPLRLPQGRHRLFLVVPFGQEGPGDLDLQSQGPQRVGQHVVDLAGDPGPLVQRRHPGLLLPQLIGLGQQHGRLLGLHAAGAQVAADDQAEDQAERGSEHDPGPGVGHHGGYLGGGDAEPGDRVPGDRVGVAARGEGGRGREQVEHAAVAGGRGDAAGDDHGGQPAREQGRVPDAQRRPPVGRHPPHQQDGRDDQGSDLHGQAAPAGPAGREGDRAGHHQQPGPDREVGDLEHPLIISGHRGGPVAGRGR